MLVASNPKGWTGISVFESKKSPHPFTQTPYPSHPTDLGLDCDWCPRNEQRESICYSPSQWYHLLATGQTACRMLLASEPQLERRLGSSPCGLCLELVPNSPLW